MIPAMLQRDTNQYAPTMADIDPDPPADPYRKLWLAVLNQAIDDLLDPKRISGGKNKAVLQHEARQWFKSADFLWVCDMLGLQPTWALQVIGRAVGSQDRQDVKLALALVIGMDDRCQTTKDRRGV
jgi:hypothetical protein